MWVSMILGGASFARIGICTFSQVKHLPMSDLKYWYYDSTCSAFLVSPTPQNADDANYGNQIKLKCS
uniref:Uncharacterized protein n=1 Tax=Anguilla anguilla TaxID=7936 RepID=A0A0E9XHH9_ANGAN